jgi:sec-independent protein translocase protein TatB
MFDISWSELLILGVVTLIFVGPKELPKFLGTLGRYAGVVRRQANEFRRIFDEAMREAELQEVKKNVDEFRQGMSETFRDVKNQTATGMSTEPPKRPAPQSPDTTQSVAPEAVAADVPKTETTSDASGATPADPAPEPKPISFPLASPAEAPKPEPLPADSKAGGAS